MRTKLLLFFLSCISFAVVGQTTQTMMYGGKTRQYKLYVPNIYNTQGVAVPLLFSLHGMGDDMNNFVGVGFHQIADTANFIVVTPQALTDTDPFLGLVGAAWNSGASMFGLSPNATVDDAGFLIAILDDLSSQYQIDQNRVYSTGFSMGAYMTHRLACEKGNRIAAIASVSGTIGVNVNCSPNGPTPMLHFHGTSDQTVSYAGNQSGMDAEEVVDYWVANNQADTTPTVTNLPNTASDGMTVEHYVYDNPSNGADVEFFKVNGADHTWLFTPQNDVDYTREIWRFLSRYSKISVGNDPLVEDLGEIKVWPNPLASGKLQFELPDQFRAQQLKITNAQGQLVMKQGIGNIGSLQVNSLPAGIYFLQFQGEKGVLTKRWMKL